MRMERPATGAIAKPNTVSCNVIPEIDTDLSAAPPSPIAHSGVRAERFSGLRRFWRVWLQAGDAPARGRCRPRHSDYMEAAAMRREMYRL